ALEHVDAGVQQDAAATQDLSETPRQLLARLMASFDTSGKRRLRYLKFLVGGADLCAPVIQYTSRLDLAIVHPEIPHFEVMLRDVGNGQLEVHGFSYYLKNHTTRTLPREACHYPLVVQDDPPSIDGARL